MFCYFPPSPQKSQSQRGVSHRDQGTRAPERWVSELQALQQGSPHLGPWLRPQNTLLILCCKQASGLSSQVRCIHSFVLATFFSLFFFASYIRLTVMHFICPLSQLSAASLSSRTTEKQTSPSLLPMPFFSPGEQQGHHSLPPVIVEPARQAWLTGLPFTNQTTKSRSKPLPTTPASVTHPRQRG